MLGQPGWGCWLDMAVWASPSGARVPWPSCRKQDGTAAFSVSEDGMSHFLAGGCQGSIAPEWLGLLLARVSPFLSKAGSRWA